MSDSVQPHRQQPASLPHPWDSPGKNTGVGCHFLLQCMKVKSESEVAQLCLTLSDPMDCSPPGSSVHGIFQARVLEWGAIAFSYVCAISSPRMLTLLGSLTTWHCSPAGGRVGVEGQVSAIKVNTSVSWGSLGKWASGSAGRGGRLYGP